MLDFHLPTNIFPSEIISGITLKNEEKFPPYGFFISKGDLLNDEEVEYNRKFLAKSLGYPREKVFFQHQIHSDIVHRARSPHLIIDSDGIITNEPDALLVLSLADCCGILVYDEKNQAIGAFHSGWKGTKQNISGKGIQKMINEFGSEPSDLKCWISPCAGAEDYEVSHDVAKFFPENSKPISEGKYLLDLKSEICSQLLRQGLQRNNIEISPESTISDFRFHSFRRDKEKSGRMAAFIGIRKT